MRADALSTYLTWDDRSKQGSRVMRFRACRHGLILPVRGQVVHHLEVC